MSKPIFTTVQADIHIANIDAPGVGKFYPHASGKVRRLLLRSTRNHVYYVEQEDRIVVVAVWGAVRGVGPDLGKL